MQVAWVQPRPSHAGTGTGPAQPGQWHPCSAEIPPSEGNASVILKDARWTVQCGAQRDRCATGRVSLDFISHIPAPSREHGDLPTALAPRFPAKQTKPIKINHHQKLCKFPFPPPPSSVKVKFHAEAVLFLFNYQPAPGTQSSPDRFSLVWLHKAREAGLLRRGGAVQGHQEPATWAACAKAGATWGRAVGASGSGFPGRAGDGQAWTPRDAPAPAG